jgi:hypothetical protein
LAPGLISSGTNEGGRVLSSSCENEMDLRLN